MLMVLLAGAGPDFGKGIFEAATKVSTGFALGAFVTAAVVAVIWIGNSKAKKNPVPVAAWIILAIAVIVPIVANLAVNLSSSNAIHHATVLILDKGSPVTDLLVFNNLNIPPKKTETAFEFDIPDSELPADKKVIFYAFKDGRQGNSSIDFSGAKSLSVQISLPENALGDILRSPLEVEAESKGKSYFIQSAAMTFDIENVSGKRVLYWRTTYSIKALKDFDEKMEIFREEYNSDYAAAPVRWVGTEPEEDVSPKGHWYYIKLKMKRGETKTFMTGADLVYDKAFPDRVAFCHNIPFGPKSDYAVFTDGVADGDYVGNILIVVNSHTIKLTPLRGTTSGVRLTRTPDCVVQNTPSRDYDNELGSYISGSWYGLKPGEEVGVLYQW